MNKQSGFTIFELLIVLAFAIAGAFVFFNQQATIDATARDRQRKVAINAMHYSLEEYYYEKNRYYPQKIDSKTLRTVDPELFTDPSGIKMNEVGAEYQYEPLECNTEGKCKRYRLKVTLEREDIFKKDSRRD